MPRRKSVETERRWRGILGRQSGCGLSVREFCEAEEISEASFYNWRRRLGAAPGLARRREAGPAEMTPGERPLFVPLAVLDTTPTLEIIHPRGCRVRVTGDVGAAALRRVLEALDQGGAE